MLAGSTASLPQYVAGTLGLIDAMPDGEGARLHALEAAGETASPEYAKLVQHFYDLHLCRRHPYPPEVKTSFTNLGRSIAYRVMNGPNEFTVTGVIKDWDRRRDLGRIRAPTLITTGEFDAVARECPGTIRQGVPGSHLEVFSGLSHLTMNEDPPRYADAVRRFLA